jgi:subtilisin family serine protease
MKNLILLMTVLITAAFPLSADSYIVKFKNQPLRNDFLCITESFEPAFKNHKSLNSKNNIKFLNKEQSKLLDSLMLYYVIETKQPEALANNENIQSITPNYKYKAEKIYKIPNDELFSSQWSLQQINARKAWEKSTGKGVVIGLIDTGVDFEHEDLIDKLWINDKEDINHNGRFDPWSPDSIIDGVSGDLNGIDEDGNGYADDVIGFDHIDQNYVNFGDYSNPDAVPEDEGDHGTSVAGIMLASTNNEKGIAGTAPDALLLTSKALDATGNGEADDIANAIVYAVLNGADILNFSFGEVYDSPIMHDAIRFAYASGVTMVASSGNNNWYGEHYPSDYPEVISVGGSDESGSKFGLSNYGSYLDIIAPGFVIWTLEQNNQYSKQSGTSLAAPIVAGIAAMLLELNPNLKPEEIRGIIQATAQDVGDAGWDVKHGAGVADASRAVSNIPVSDISITSPYDKKVFTYDSLENINIFGSVLTPLFDSYELLIGDGILPDEWRAIQAPVYFQVKDSLLGVINTSFLLDTGMNHDNFTEKVHTLSLKVTLKNQKTIERRIQIKVISNPEHYEIVEFNHRQAYEGNKSVYMFYGKTNQRTLFSLKYRLKGTEKWQNINDDIAQDYFHLIKIDDVKYDLTYEAKAEFRFANNEILTKDFEFTVENLNFREDRFVKKFESNKRNYLWNQTADLYNNGIQYFAGNDLSMLDIGIPEIYYYEDMEIYRAESGKDIWICKGLGDTDGNGNMEFLGTGDHKTILYEFNPENGSIFENIKFRSENGNTFWSEHLFDIDNDGKDEIIAYNDTSFFAVNNIDDNFDDYIFAPIKPSLKRYGIVKGSALGDFNGNGKIELAHTNSFGMVFIYEYDGNSFNNVFIDSNIVSQSNQYMASGDFNNDGKDEIIHLSSGSRYLYGEDAAVKSVWYLKVYSYENNEYKILADEVFFGVRSGFISRLGISYRNGIASGNIDGVPGDEILISTFPNLYALKFNDNVLKPFWYTTNVLSNDILVEDFDGNGINEIGFSSFNNVVFYEYQPENDAPTTPINVKGWATSDTTAYLEWTGSGDAELYQIYEIIFSENSAEAKLITLSQQESITIDSLEKNKEYLFSVVAFNSDRNEQYSEFSDLVEIYTHKLYKPLEIDVISSNQVEIVFSGDIKKESHPAGNFIIQQLNQVIPASLLNSSRNKVLLTYSEDLPNGQYELIAGELRDIFNSPTVIDTLTFEINEEIQNDELYLKRLELVSKSLIKLEFSESVIAEQAINVENYEIKPFGEIEFVSIGSGDTNFIMMNISSVFRTSAARGIDYTLTAKNITSMSGKPMTSGAGNTLGFVISSQSLDDAYIYPNPVRLSSGETIFIANLTKEAVVEIMTLDGEVLSTLTEKDGNGGVEWDGTDSSGKILSPGIYLFKVEGTSSNGGFYGPVIKKFMILE